MSHSKKAHSECQNGSLLLAKIIHWLIISFGVYPRKYITTVPYHTVPCWGENTNFAQFQFSYLCPECSCWAAAYGGSTRWDGIGLWHAGLIVTEMKRQYNWFKNIILHGNAPKYGVELNGDVQDLEETASVGRGSPVQQELEDSETEASILCHLKILSSISNS